LAADYNQRAQRAAGEDGDHEWLCYYCGEAAECFEDLGSYQSAEEKFKEQLKLMTKYALNNGIDYCRRLNWLAWCYQAEGKNDLSYATVSQAMNQSASMHDADPDDLADLTVSMARLLIALEHYSDAQKLLKNELNALKPDPDDDERIYVQAALGESYMKVKDWQSACANLSAAFEQCTGKNHCPRSLRRFICRGSCVSLGAIMKPK